jgi:uncharacterized membrane protein
VMFINFLMWLTIPNSAVMCVDTIHVECYATFITKSVSTVIVTICVHVYVIVCILCQEYGVGKI